MSIWISVYFLTPTLMDTQQRKGYNDYYFYNFPKIAKTVKVMTRETTRTTLKTLQDLEHRFLSDSPGGDMVTSCSGSKRVRTELSQVVWSGRDRFECSESNSNGMTSIFCYK
jgi:hypothetical protein